MSAADAGVKGTVYLLHFTPAYRHARHYLGWALDVEARLEQHRRGAGSPLVAAAVAAGSTVEVARTWPDVDRHFERHLKNRREAPRLCPLCVAQGTTRNRALLGVTCVPV